MVICSEREVGVHQVRAAHNQGWDENMEKTSLTAHQRLAKDEYMKFARLLFDSQLNLTLDQGGN